MTTPINSGEIAVIYENETGQYYATEEKIFEQINAGVEASPKQIEDYSAEELRAELDRREAQNISYPPPLSGKTNDEIVLQIYGMVKDCVDDAVKDDHWDEYYEKHIFMVVMKAIYGDDYFDCHNKRFQ